MVDLKKLKPIGVFMILFFSALAVILCFTADMGVPEAYTPQHDYEYYTQSTEHMQELLKELEEHEFSRLDGIKSYSIAPGEKTIAIYIDEENYGMVSSVLNRDFGETLFEYYKWEE